MNCCKEIDKYISLYLDDLLEDKVKKDFLKHINECNQCSTKLKEASFVADLCREDEDIELPESFSISLHERLLEVNENKVENKIWTFMRNKRLIASLSTAAVLVVSLLAYNILPHRVSSEATSMANDTLQVQTPTAAKDNSKSSEAISKTLPKDTDDSVSSNGNMSDNTSSNNTGTSSKEAGIQTESMPKTKRKPAAQNNDVTVTLNESVSDAKKNNTQPADQRQDNEATTSSNKELDKKLEIDTSSYTLSSENQANANEYFTNYAELNLKVSSAGIEIEDLRKIMKEFNAIELKPVTISSVAENSIQNSLDDSEALVESPKYIDYYLSLSDYSALENAAKEQFNLDLSMKTDIIKTDNSDKYNSLNTQKVEIDRELAQEDIMVINVDELLTKKAEITKEIEKIASEKEMITVRIFYSP